jgi:hypothetical protein
VAPAFLGINLRTQTKEIWETRAHQFSMKKISTETTTTIAIVKKNNRNHTNLLNGARGAPPPRRQYHRFPTEKKLESFHGENQLHHINQLSKKANRRDGIYIMQMMSAATPPLRRKVSSSKASKANGLPQGRPPPTTRPAPNRPCLGACTLATRVQWGVGSKVM